MPAFKFESKLVISHQRKRAILPDEAQWSWAEMWHPEWCHIRAGPQDLQEGVERL